MILAIDFDHVIHDKDNPIEGRRMGAPITGAKEALLSFRRKGWKIRVFSVGGAEGKNKWIADFMKYYGIPFDEITNIKQKADYFIDDKAIRFTVWSEVLKQIHEPTNGKTN